MSLKTDIGANSGSHPSDLTTGYRESSVPTHASSAQVNGTVAKARGTSTGLPGPSWTDIDS